MIDDFRGRGKVWRRKCSGLSRCNRAVRREIAKIFTKWKRELDTRKSFASETEEFDDVHVPGIHLIVQNASAN